MTILDIHDVDMFHMSYADDFAGGKSQGPIFLQLPGLVKSHIKRWKDPPLLNRYPAW